MAHGEGADLVVVGGGVLGLAIAYHAAARDLDVLVLERGELGREASGTNAGTLHFQTRRADQTSPERIELVRRAVLAWRGLGELLGGDLEVRAHGGLMLAETPDEADQLAAKSGVDTRMGLTTELLFGADLHQAYPCLSSRVLAATRCAEEGSANPLTVTAGYARRARELGVRVRTHQPVVAIRERPGGGYTVVTVAGEITAGRIVLAAGAWTRVVAAMAGVDIPVTGVAQMVSVTERRRPLLDPIVQHIGRPLTLKQTRAGTVLVGGGWLADDTRVCWDNLAGNLGTAAHLLPGLAGTRVLRSWVGVIPATPDLLPYTGETAPGSGCWIAVLPRGYAGFTLAPAVAPLVARQLVDGGAAGPLALFAPPRRPGPAAAEESAHARA